jgi:hypothetical protein
LFFHYNLVRPLSPLSLGDFGYRAVTFFFALSGFILAHARDSKRRLSRSTEDLYQSVTCEDQPSLLIPDLHDRFVAFHSG